MTTLMLVRHGETLWNKEEIFRGRADIELNVTGLKQAGLLGAYLADTKISAIYSSPLKRAVQTAQSVAGYQQIPVTVAEELNDLDFGEWQGLSVETVRSKYKELFIDWQKNPQSVKIPGGESLDDVRQRALKLAELVITGDKAVVAFVSHRVINKVLICALLGLDNSHFWNIKVDTCGVTTFIYENDRFVLARHNDTSFLRPCGEAVLKDF
jgi:broad specificity phosphatase PhoE